MKDVGLRSAQANLRTRLLESRNRLSTNLLDGCIKQGKMDSKYKNIFWHQGVKIFEEDLLSTEKGRLRIDHLENDVTKALLNLFQHCKSNKVLKAFLQLVSIAGVPETFEFDFQVRDSSKYRQKNNRIMLSIVSDMTQRKSQASSSDEKKSIPDACIFNKNTSVLIESKTQSPLIDEQVQSHIKQYLVTATKQRIITWEDISEKFKSISGTLPPIDKFLVIQFCEFLELIGIAEFNGFISSDFSMLGSIITNTPEDYLDFKRMLHRKIEKFNRLLYDDVKQGIVFKKNLPKVMRVNPKTPGVWSAIYFYDDDANINVNHYPNINFMFTEHGMELAINGETQSSFKLILSRVTEYPDKFESIAYKLDGFDLSIFYKFQYLPKNNFIWNPIPGFPRPMNAISVKKIIGKKMGIEKDWNDIKNTLIYQMKSGSVRHRSGRFFNNNEIKYAREYNRGPNYAIRIGKSYHVADVERLDKPKIIKLFKNEISRLDDCLRFILQ